MKRKLVLMGASVLAAAWTIGGCESQDPDERAGTQCAADPGAAACEPDQGTVPSDNAGCTPLDTDYRPREMGSSNDAWPACISDDNTWHPFNASVGSNARVAAFEEIAALLGFDGSKVASCEDFVKAKVAWSQPEGLQSRVSRREDVHYAPVVRDGKEVSCRELTGEEIEAHAQRCVGQALLQPMIEDALNQGSAGSEPVRNAARVEAALLWFLYVSVPKELQTCGTADKEDCDSATGYYAGTQSRDNPVGLGRYVKARSPQAHDRVWDGLLAARCWRELDPSLPHADSAMMMRAVEQTDRALLRGMALIVRSRLANARSCPFAWQSVQVLGTLLLRAADERDPMWAGVLQTEAGRSEAAQLDVKAATDAIDALFPCP